MFRAGTTFLSYLLDQDPRNRALLRWEAGDSVPPPTPDDHRGGPRVDAVHASNDMLEQLNPQIEVIHHEEADEATECITVMSQDFKSLSWEAIANVPTYGRWLLGVDQRSAYEYHRSVLQVLQSGGVRGRWTLKSPHHAIALERAHRGVPRRAARAAAPRSGRAVRVGVQPHHHAVVDVQRRRPPRLHRRALGGDARGVDRAASTRSAPRIPSTRSSTCSTPTSSPTPPAPSRRSTTRAATSSTTSAAKAITQYVDAHPKGQFGVHRYDLAEFGLDADALAERFAGYTERYDVPRETPAA